MSDSFCLKKSYNLKLSFGWKGHILQHHLIPFLQLKNMGLGVFAEQCSEAVHHNMKKTLGRYATDEENKDHGRKLEKAVATYSSMRV